MEFLSKNHKFYLGDNHMTKFYKSLGMFYYKLFLDKTE